MDFGINNFFDKKHKDSKIGHFQDLEHIDGLSISTISCGLYNKKRDDLVLFYFRDGANYANVYTKSSLVSENIKWNKKIKDKKIYGILINTRNANALTGNDGYNSLKKISLNLSKLLSSKQIEDEEKPREIKPNQILFACTGTIGEKFPENKILNTLKKDKSKTNNWLQAAQSIMTTDTFPKAISVKTMIENKTITITGIAKGSGMIEPNMATMLGFIFIDCLIPQNILQKLLKDLVDKSFNQITVDGDESTNDTVIMTSTNSVSLKNKISSIKDKRISKIKNSLLPVVKYLAEQIVRDGEGATKLINIKVESAKNSPQAKRIAKAVANSPLVKTAFYGNDPNWGRIVMAIGKTYEKIDPKKLKIYIGKQTVVANGAEYKKLNLQKLKKYMASKEIDLKLDLGQGNYSYETQTCDFSHKYVDINAAYRT